MCWQVLSRHPFAVKLPFHVVGSRPHLIMASLTTRVRNPNGISIGSAVLLGSPSVTGRPNVVVVDNDDDNSRIVTKLLFNTCLLLQPSLYRDIRAAVARYALAATVARKSSHDDVGLLGHTRVDDEVHVISLITGSSAEFYIQPMLLCVGDVDIMCHYSTELAIPDGYPPPTELPAEFDCRAEVYEIIDSGYPGYVYLLSSYLLTEDSDTGKYNAVRYHNRQYVRYVPVDVAEGERHGPALTFPDSVMSSMRVCRK